MVLPPFRSSHLENQISKVIVFIGIRQLKRWASNVVQTSKEDNLISRLRQQSYVYAAAHYAMVSRYKLVSNLINYSIALSSLLVTFFLAFYSDFGHYQEAYGSVTAFLSIITALLAVIQTFSNIHYLIERHSVAAKNYGLLRQDIELLELRAEIDKPGTLNNIEAIYKELLRLDRDAPPLSSSSIRHAVLSFEKSGPLDRANAELDKLINKSSYGVR